MDDAITGFQVGDLRSCLDGFTHILVTQDIAFFHGRLITIEKMQIRSAYGASRNLDDRAPRMQEFGISDGIYADVAFSMPAECAHLCSFRDEMDYRVFPAAARDAAFNLTVIVIGRLIE